MINASQQSYFLKNVALINFYTINIFYLLCKQKHKVQNIHILFIQHISQIFPSPFDESWRFPTSSVNLYWGESSWTSLESKSDQKQGQINMRTERDPDILQGQRGWRLHLDWEMYKLHRAVSVIIQLIYTVHIMCVIVLLLIVLVHNSADTATLLGR